MTSTKRWTLVNRKTGKFGHSFTTRATARTRKTSTQRIYDTREMKFVR